MVYSTHKKEQCESVLMRQMDLEPIMQSEVSQKETSKCILTPISGIQKNGTDEPVCRAAMET